jgi:hypothetical protein
MTLPGTKVPVLAEAVVKYIREKTAAKAWNVYDPMAYSIMFSGVPTKPKIT